MLTWLTIFAVGVFLGLVISAVTGLPGVLLAEMPALTVLQNRICPPRGIAVCDSGIVLVNRSWLTSRPKRLLAQFRLDEIRPVEATAGQIRIVLGAESVWLEKKEEASFRKAVAASGGVPSGHSSP